MMNAAPLPVLLALLLAGPARALPADSISFPMECGARLEFSWGTTVAYAPDGSFYVASLIGGGVARLASDGPPLTVMTGDDANPPFVLLPVGVAVGAQGEIDVANCMLNRVERFSALGIWEGAFGAGALNDLVGIATDPRNGRVAVVDRHIGQSPTLVRVFLGDSVLVSFPVDTWAQAITIDPTGNIYVTGLSGTVEKHDEWGAPLASWSVANVEFRSLAVGPNGRVHVGGVNHRVYVLSHDLEPLGTWDLSCMEPEACVLPGDSGELTGIAIDSNGNAVLVFECRSMNIQTFRPGATVPTRNVTWGRLKAIYR